VRFTLPILLKTFRLPRWFFTHCSMRSLSVKSFSHMVGSCVSMVRRLCARGVRACQAHTGGRGEHQIRETGGPKIAEESLHKRRAGNRTVPQFAGSFTRFLFKVASVRTRRVFTVAPRSGLTTTLQLPTVPEPFQIVVADRARSQDSWYSQFAKKLLANDECHRALQLLPRSLRVVHFYAGVSWTVFKPVGVHRPP
jgi:hypothetical protein